MLKKIWFQKQERNIRMLWILNYEKESSVSYICSRKKKNRNTKVSEAIIGFERNQETKYI